jgi:TM2 domain-containing membrane protein YozV
MTDPDDPHRPANSPPEASPAPYPVDPNPYAAQPPGDPFAAYPPVSGTPSTFQYPAVSGTAPLPVVYPPVSGPTAYPPALVSGPMGYGAGAYDPYTGQPLSDKSKIVAGLLQLLPGFMLGLGGIGRLYAGQTALGVTQLILTVFGWISFWCGFLLFFPFLIYAGLWVWFVVDGIVLMAGRPVDGQGRLLKT